MILGVGGERRPFMDSSEIWGLCGFWHRVEINAVDVLKIDDHNGEGGRVLIAAKGVNRPGRWANFMEVV